MKGKAWVLYLAVVMALLLSPAAVGAEGLTFLENNPELKARLLQWEKAAPPVGVEG